MNKIALAACALAAAPIAHATLLLNEQFNYTPGQTLATAEPAWTQFTVASGSSNHIDTHATNLSVGGLAASTGGSISLQGAGSGNNHTFAAQTSGTVFFSFALQVTSLTGFTTTSASSFVSLQATGNSTANKGAGIFMAPVINSGVTTGYTLNINKLNNAITGGSPSNITLQAGTTYFIVGSYQIVSGSGNDTVSLWVAPASSSFGATSPAASVSVTSGTDLATTSGLNNIIIQQMTGSALLPSLLIDELRVGTTWADVTPVAAIPEPSSAAALIGGLAIGFAGLRRRSRR